MKSFLKKFIVTVSLLSIITMNVEAETLSPANVQLLGNANGLVHLPEEELFLFYPNMHPGDRITRTLEIKNQYEHPYEVFIRAKRVSNEEKYDLLNKLQLKITYKNKIIYDGPTSGEDNLSQDISLGIFKPGEEEKLVATVELDGPSTGNEYKNKYAQVDWIFTAVRDEEEVNPPKPPVTPPTNPTVKPPKTGDKGMLLYVLLGGSSILILLISRKKSK